MTGIPDLLAVLAHEMRTPIAAILGYQELLSEGIYGSVDERGKEPLDRIAYSARQLLHLIDGVQEISMPAAKRLSMHIEVFEPAPLLHSCLAYAHADAVGRHVELATDFPPALPPITGDPDRFCRALDLALSAAIKSSHGATITVGAAVIDQELCISIGQTGLSLDRDDPGFVREANGKLTGSGLRLAIVREIARQMHGGLELNAGPAGTSILLRFRGADAT